MEQDIVQYIGEQKVATIACVDNNMPYCFNCYYSFIEEEALLIYKSSLNTHHEQLLEKNKNIAGTIIPEQIDVTTIRGIQFEGMLLNETWELTMKASSSYYLRFPFAMAVPGKLYLISLHSVKFTDNTKGFGHKQHWQKK
ncbi:MAG TPA: hypothetical protein VL093_10930 [Flavipsychrobacter sp.]|nr:hypothetical protein [Flavipsychrobacter sp.]